MSCSITKFMFFVTALTIINAFQNRDVLGVRKRHTVHRRSCRNYCDNRPCTNGGLCINTRSSFFCNCPCGFTGRVCENNINDCDSNPCENGGMCQDGVANFSCLCDGTGFTGKLCECNVNDCASNPCGENGRCTDEISGFNCFCDDGFTGNNCETDIDDCASNPCGENGQCTDQISGFNCFCDDGFTGNNCEIACNTPFDIVVAVDSTNDIDVYPFLANAIANAIRDFAVDPALRNVGVVSFGSVKGDVINITGDIEQLVQSIRALGYPGLGTNTRLGIEEAQMLLEMQGRPEVPDVMIVYVEGKTDTGGDPIQAATDAKSKGTDIYVIGIGDVDMDELHVIASADSQVKIESRFVFTERFFEQIALQIC